MECIRPSVIGDEAPRTPELPHLSDADETLQHTDLRQKEQPQPIWMGGAWPTHVLSSAHGDNHMVQNVILLINMAAMCQLYLSCKIRTNVTLLLLWMMWIKSRQQGQMQHSLKFPYARTKATEPRQWLLRKTRNNWPNVKAWVITGPPLKRTHNC